MDGILNEEDYSRGNFAIDGDKTKFEAEFMQFNFIPKYQDGLQNKGIEVLTKGICNAPGWDNHGSVFMYNLQKDTWLEYNCELKVITNNWMRVGSDNKNKDVKYEISHPLSGTFAIDGNKNGWIADFKESKFIPRKSQHLGNKGIEVILPSICNAPAWCSHGSLFMYEFEKDAWLEYDCSSKKITCIWTRI